MTLSSRTLLAIASLALAAPARAAGNEALAETLFREGKSLMDAGNYQQGCPKLAASYGEDPATGTLLALSACEEAAGKLASAWAHYVDAAARARTEGRQDREDAARAKAQALEPRLSKLTLVVDPKVGALPGFVLLRDGVPVVPAALGTAVPTDGGEHVLEARADGKRPYRTTVVLGTERDANTVTIARLEDAPAPGAADSASPKSGGLGTLQILGIGLAGGGVVGLGVATYFGLHAKSLNSDSNDQGCDGNLCPPDAAETRRDARSAGNMATVFLVAGSVLAVGGVSLYLAFGPKSERASAVHLSVGAAPGVAALSASGKF